MASLWFWSANTDINNVNVLAKYAEQAMSAYSDSLNYSVGHQINMVIYPSKCSFHLSNGLNDCNHWVIGTGLGCSDFQMVTPSELHGINYGIDIMKHEFAHVFQYNINSYMMNPLFEEGFASFMGGAQVPDVKIYNLKKQLKNHLDNLKTQMGRYPTLDEMGNPFFVDQNGIGVYLIGHGLYDWMVKKEGYETLKSFILSTFSNVNLYGFQNDSEYFNAFIEWAYDLEGIQVERPVAYAYKIPETINSVIDGQPDSFWDSVEEQPVNLHYNREYPEFNENPIFKLAYNDKALYVLVTINDDEWAPSWVTGVPGYLSDCPELYLDVNNILHDGQGAEEGANGHY